MVRSTPIPTSYLLTTIPPTRTQIPPGTILTLEDQLLAGYLLPSPLQTTTPTPPTQRAETSTRVSGPGCKLSTTVSSPAKLMSSRSPVVLACIIPLYLVRRIRSPQLALHLVSNQQLFRSSKLLSWVPFPGSNLGVVHTRDQTAADGLGSRLRLLYHPSRGSLAEGRFAELGRVGSRTAP